MKDKFERFIRDNREDFDELEPRLQVWNKINDQLRPGVSKLKTNVFPIRKAMKLIAAALMLIFLSIGGIRLYLSKSKLSEDPEMAVIDANYAKLTFRYTSLIDEKRIRLNKSKSLAPALYRDFAEDYNLLEQNYMDLKNQLPNTLNKKVLIKAIIKNLQLQAGLLSQQIEILNKTQKPVKSNSSSKSQSNESIHI